MSGLRIIRKLKSWFEGKEDDVKIGWYSEKQRNCNWRLIHVNEDGYEHPSANIYLTPEGKEITVTEVTDGLTTSSKWDDMKMVGPVSKWVRSIYSMHITKFHESQEMNLVKSMFPSYEKWEKILNKSDKKINKINLKFESPV